MSRLKVTFYAYVDKKYTRLTETFTVSYDEAVEMLTTKYKKIYNVEFVFV